MSNAPSNTPSNMSSKPQETANEAPRFHVFRLLGVILGVNAVIAVICYALQVHYLGVG